ncbi:MAG: MFS transporter [Pseudomonadota bacterium]
MGRLCAGIGGAVLVVVAPQIIARTFHGRELGLAMGLFNTAVPLGTILAFNVLGYLGGRFGIPMVFLATTFYSILVLTSFYLTYADQPAVSGKAGYGAESTADRLGAGIWFVSAVWVLFNISILAYFTYAIDHLSSSGLEGTSARFLTSLPMLLSIFLTPVAGLAMHRFGLRWSLAYSGCFISCAAIYLLLTPDRGMIVILSVLLGIGISMVPPAVFTLAGELVPPARTGTGYGLLTATFNLGVFFGIPLVGRARDLSPSYSSSFILMAVIMCLAGVVAAAASRLLTK